MKNIKFLFALILFVGMKTNASESINRKEELIKQLSVDETFKTIMTNSSNIVLAYSFIGDVSKMSPELIQVIKNIKLQNEELKKIVLDKYPAYKNLSLEDKKEVITTIFTTTFSQSWFKCVGTQFGNFVVCVGITQLWDLYSKQARRSIGCFATAVGADTAEAIGTGGAATPAIPAEVATEAIWCARLAYGAYVATAATVTTCAEQTITKVLKCGSQN